jgi:hypothetical protein
LPQDFLTKIFYIIEIINDGIRMTRLFTVIIIVLLASVQFYGTVYAFNEVETVVQKKVAFPCLSGIGLSIDEAEKYSTYMQIALAKATQWKLIDYSTTASLIAERRGAERCVNLQCAVLNGQLLDVDYICIGSIEVFGTTYSMALQVVDVNSGRMVASASKFFKGKEKTFVTRTIPSFAEQIATTIIGKKRVAQNQNNIRNSSLEKQISEQANKSFGDVRGYMSYGTAEDKIETDDKLAFGYLYNGMGMKSDDIFRYSYQLQSYLADVGACEMLYIDEMERLMKVRGGNLKCKDAKCAENVGKLLGVNYLGYGKISKFFGFYFVRVYIIDVDNGKKAIKQSRCFREKELIFLTESIPHLAHKLGEEIKVKELIPGKL